MFRELTDDVAGEQDDHSQQGDGQGEDGVVGTANSDLEESGKIIRKLRKENRGTENERGEEERRKEYKIRKKITIWGGQGKSINKTKCEITMRWTENLQKKDEKGQTKREVNRQMTM